MPTNDNNNEIHCHKTKRIPTNDEKKEIRKRIFTERHVIFLTIPFILNESRYENNGT